MDAVIWCKEALQSLANKDNHTVLAPDFPLPPTIVADSLLPCPTVRLTSRFLEHLATGIQTRKSQDVKADSANVARDVLDAFVYSVHGLQIAPDDAATTATTARSDFGAIVVYFPYALRLLIQVCIQQCQQQPNPLWPAYLLKLVDRKDLCGEFKYSLLVLFIVAVRVHSFTLLELLLFFCCVFCAQASM